MVFFTADQHFNHPNIITYCKRPFQSVQEMNNVLIKNWNYFVKPGDTVYILGDLFYNKINHEEILNSLNGEKILIIGDHDAVKKSKYFKHSYSYFFYQHENIKIALFHWCIRSWQQSHYNTFHLYGHSHGKLPPIGKSWDIGVDNNNFTPVSFDEVIEIMAKRPDNPNLIKRREPNEVPDMVR